MEYKKELPLALVVNIDKLLIELRAICRTNSEIVEYRENTGDTLFRMDDSDTKSSFFYEITAPRIEKGKPVYTVQFTPKDDFSLAIEKISHNYEGVITTLNFWLDLIKKYNSTDVSPESRFISFYEGEFLNTFKIENNDTDANINPFDIKSQLAISVFLDAASVVLERHNISEDDEIFTEIRDLKANQQNLVKKKVVKKLSRILALIWEKGIELFKTVGLETIKELTKRGISGLFDFFGQLPS